MITKAALLTHKLEELTQFTQYRERLTLTGSIELLGPDGEIVGSTPQANITRHSHSLYMVSYPEDHIHRLIPVQGWHNHNGSTYGRVDISNKLGSFHGEIRIQPQKMYSNVPAVPDQEFIFDI